MSIVITIGIYQFSCIGFVPCFLLILSTILINTGIFIIISNIGIKNEI